MIADCGFLNGIGSRKDAKAQRRGNEALTYDFRMEEGGKADPWALGRAKARGPLPGGGSVITDQWGSGRLGLCGCSGSRSGYALCQGYLILKKELRIDANVREFQGIRSAQPTLPPLSSSFFPFPAFLGALFLLGGSDFFSRFAATR
jgi:hypothetical protein